MTPRIRIELHGNVTTITGPSGSGASDALDQMVRQAGSNGRKVMFPATISGLKRGLTNHAPDYVGIERDSCLGFHNSADWRGAVNELARAYPKTHFILVDY